ncbi:hypothetical protein [Plantactinospora endophytica]|uniref:Adhesin domain-containing protein n=1 Tax=Plantactinospora endophytica TaxID=673535 RepID=A0ABQ4EB29_9ACTN|nr:hypothetical protein [Plantactinospora endophytica]GIG91903.1 hypothetical protein Pen02_68390 [Plantactinospora endophytica]
MLLGAAVLAGVTGCADLRAVDSARTDERRFTLAGPALTIDTHGADLRVVAGDGPEVEVRRSLTGKATLPENAGWELTGDTLRLAVTCSGFVPDCGGSHVVGVPAGTDVRVTSRDGAVRTVGLTGDLTAEVRHGWLRVERPAGLLRLTAGLALEVTEARSTDVTARSSGGDVRLSFAVAPRRVTATAELGSVDVALPAGPETYRISTVGQAGSGGSGPVSDPASERVVRAVADNGRAQVRTGK